MPTTEIFIFPFNDKNLKWMNEQKKIQWSFNGVLLIRVNLVVWN